MIEYTAPGKLFLAGEYAVLEGHPGLILTVGVRATARAMPGGWTWISGNGRQYGFTPSRSEGLRWADVRPADGRLVQSLMGQLAAELESSAQPLRLSVQTHEFTGQGPSGPAKFGLGSSAAAMVALCAVVMEGVRGAAADPAEVESIAAAAHADFQGGRGSGADISASVSGGFVEYRRLDGNGTAEPLTWPEGLGLVPVWTGVSANTVPRVARFLSAGPDSLALREDLGASARNASECFRLGETAACRDAIANYSQRLRELDQLLGLDIWSPVHTAVAQALAAQEAVYKPSGAGGGDCGLVLVAANQVGQVRQTLNQAGFATPGWQLCVPGLGRSA